MRNETEVLIVGAGPSGLMLACQLASQGIRFRIIEKNSGPNPESRALAIHAGSMELFAQMGLAEEFIQHGRKLQAINYLLKGDRSRRIPLSEFGQGLSAFPFLLILEQSRTEHILIQYLHAQEELVEWNTELLSFSQDEDFVHAKLGHAGKPEENIRARWMVGTDGAKSRVRHMLDIPFEGKTYPVDLFVLDCRVNWSLRDDEAYIAFSSDSLAVFFPMPEGRCRLIGLVPEELRDAEKISFEDISKGFSERMQMDINLYDPEWISVYHSHHRHVDRFREGRCFLAGDAAHIHSPVGAQGMNTGLQDACNLAWKLALVVKGLAKEKLLDTYEDERLPFAKRLVKTIDRAFHVAVHQGAFVRFMLMYLAPVFLKLLLKLKLSGEIIFRNVSQTGISYKKGLLVNGNSVGSFPRTAPKPGDRVPYVLYRSSAGVEMNIQDKADDIFFNLFLFTGKHGNARAEFLREMEPYRYCIQVDAIPRTPFTEELYKAFGIIDAGYYLIRPDLYIAYRSNSLALDSFRNFLNSVLLKRE